MASSNPEYFYHWDLTYTNFSRFDVLGAWDDDSYVFNVSNSLTGLVQKGTATNGKVVRFDGKNWITSANFDTYYQNRVSYGDDYAIWTVDDRDRPVVGFRRQYDPNTLSWLDVNLTYTPNETVFGNNDGHNPVRAGVNFFSFTDKIYFRKPDGSWAADYTFSPPSGVNVAASSLRVGSDKYFIYRYSTNAKVVQFIKNGAISSTDNTVTGRYDYSAGLAAGMLDLVRDNTIVTYSTSSINDATSLILYRILDEKASGAFVDYPVTLITTNDASQNHFTSFVFNAATATFDVTGTVASYNEITTIPGSNSPSSQPFGYTKTFFYNGLNSTELGVSFMPVDLRWNGIPYETQVFEANNTTPIASTRNTYTTFSRDLLNDVNAKVDVGYYVRPDETISVIDGIETKTDNESYDANTGLVKQTSTSRGTGFVVRNYLKYWWEVYDNGTTPRALNLLSPVIQTKRTVNGQTVEVSATRWKSWPCAACTSGSAPAPFDTYVWKRGGTEDFTAWNEIDPVSTTDWKFLNSVQVNDEGQVFETTDISGKSRSTLFHPTLPRVLADISNASAGEVLYEGFEDCVANCSTDTKTGSKSSQAAYNVVLPASGTYTLTYWSLDPITGEWSLNVSEISSNTTIGGSGAIIDEVRLHPPDARMTTYAYDEYGNLTSVCDENNEIIYTEYDGFNRMKLVRDTEGNILKHRSYNFKVN